MSIPTERYDVVVAGGGAAGVAAAVGAARLGARTLLVERYGFLGGAATNALVLSYCGFYTGGSAEKAPVRTIGGVGWELMLRLQKMGFDTAPVRSKSGNQIIMIDVEALKVALDRTVLAQPTGSDIALQFHTKLVAAHRIGEQLQAVTVADHRGLHDVEAAAFVDASGEASLSAFAGVAMSQPGGPGAHLQPASLPVRIDGVPPDVVFDRALMTRLIADYNATAEIPMPRADGGVVMRLPVSQDIWWMTVDLDTDGVSGSDLARAETSARERSWRFLEVLRRHPGFERAHLAATGPQLGIRESRRPFSLGDVAAADGLAGRRSEHGIARASWPMEVHVAPGQQRFVPIGGEGFFDVPHAAIQARGVANLRLAGRVIGADAEAYGSVRVMGTAFATGQAAGVSAALWAAKTGADTARVRAVLQEQNALV
jgi:2-polyprenyl-6-methoxyphenol hydroxylase-like FAD-dependent oxidoreductase